jgi:hypothetical protein
MVCLDAGWRFQSRVAARAAGAAKAARAGDLGAAGSELANVGVLGMHLLGGFIRKDTPGSYVVGSAAEADASNACACPAGVATCTFAGCAAPWLVGVKTETPSPDGTLTLSGHVDWDGQRLTGDLDVAATTRAQDYETGLRFHLRSDFLTATSDLSGTARVAGVKTTTDPGDVGEVVDVTQTFVGTDVPADGECPRGGHIDVVGLLNRDGANDLGAGSIPTSKVCF